MSTETREKKRERLGHAYVNFREELEDHQDALLSIVEASELQAAEKARASERERCEELLIEQRNAYAKEGRGEYWALQAAIEVIRAAPPSPEPERASFPNACHETHSGNLPPLGREPEALTEARVREIVNEELNARPYLEYTRTLKPLVERVEILESRAEAAGLRSEVLEELLRRVGALERWRRLMQERR